MAKRTLAVMALVVMACVCGCATPTLEVRHALQPGIALPAIQNITISGFPTEGDAPASTDRYVSGLLAERLKKSLTLPAKLATPPAMSGKKVQISGTVTTDFEDAKQTHSIQQWDESTRTLSTREVPSLRRTGWVRIVFDIQDMEGNRLGGVETFHEYRSSADPRLRGPLGLQRPYAPNEIPSTKKIFEELVDQCVASFCRIAAPVVHTRTLKMRWMFNGTTMRGLQAARNEKWSQAESLLQDVVKRSPQSADAHYNLAVVLEAQGKLQQASQEYRKAYEVSKQKDLQADTDAKETERLLIRTRPVSSNLLSAK